MLSGTVPGRRSRYVSHARKRRIGNKDGTAVIARGDLRTWNDTRPTGWDTRSSIVKTYGLVGAFENGHLNDKTGRGKHVCVFLFRSDWRFVRHIYHQRSSRREDHREQNRPVFPKPFWHYGPLGGLSIVRLNVFDSNYAHRQRSNLKKKK